MTVKKIILFPLIIISTVAFSACKNDDTTNTNMNRMNNLTHLFDAQLQYNDTVNVTVPMEGRTGDFIGKGDGTVKGKKITGVIRWEFYAENCAYLWVKKGQQPPANQHLCKTN